VKKIIFSQYAVKPVDEHTSSSDYKRAQFAKYQSRLEESQKEYALLCNADYECFKTPKTNYDLIQFDKLHLFEELAQTYDEVLYLDMDVVPQTNVNFFEHHDLDFIQALSYDRTPKSFDKLNWKLKHDNFDRFNVYAKTCCKQAMLLLHDFTGNTHIINTGVLGGNKKSIEELNFKERLDECYKTFHEAHSDNLFPSEIYKTWRPNNECFITFIVDLFNVKFNNVGIHWNFCLDDYSPKPTPAAHFLHHIRKEFELSYE